MLTTNTTATTAVPPPPVTEQDDVKDPDEVSITSAATPAGDDSKTGSGLDYIDELPKLIDGMLENYINIYVNVMQKYTDYVGEIADLKTLISKSSTASGSDKIVFDAGPIFAKIAEIEAKFNSIDNAMYVAHETGAAGYAECVKWAKELGLNPDAVIVCVGDDKANGQYFIQADLSPLFQIRESIKNGEMPTNLYQQMAAGIDIQVQKVNNTIQKLAEKYSNANANMDSLMKMLSNILAELQRILAQMLS